MACIQGLSDMMKEANLTKFGSAFSVPKTSKKPSKDYTEKPADVCTSSGLHVPTPTATVSKTFTITYSPTFSHSMSRNLQSTLTPTSNVLLQKDKKCEVNASLPSNTLKVNPVDYPESFQFPLSRTASSTVITDEPSAKNFSSSNNESGMTESTPSIQVYTDLTPLRRLTHEEESYTPPTTSSMQKTGDLLSDFLRNTSYTDEVLALPTPPDESGHDSDVSTRSKSCFENDDLCQNDLSWDVRKLRDQVTHLRQVLHLTKMDNESLKEKIKSLEGEHGRQACTCPGKRNHTEICMTMHEIS